MLSSGSNLSYNSLRWLSFRFRNSFFWELCVLEDSGDMLTMVVIVWGAGERCRRRFCGVWWYHVNLAQPFVHSCELVYGLGGLDGVSLPIHHISWCEWSSRSLVFGAWRYIDYPYHMLAGFYCRFLACL